MWCWGSNSRPLNMPGMHSNPLIYLPFPKFCVFGFSLGVTLGSIQEPLLKGSLTAILQKSCSPKDTTAPTHKAYASTLWAIFLAPDHFFSHPKYPLDKGKWPHIGSDLRRYPYFCLTANEKFKEISFLIISLDWLRDSTVPCTGLTHVQSPTPHMVSRAHPKWSLDAETGVRPEHSQLWAPPPKKCKS